MNDATGQPDAAIGRRSALAAVVLLAGAVLTAAGPAAAATEDAAPTTSTVETRSVRDRPGRADPNLERKRLEEPGETDAGGGWLNVVGAMALILVVLAAVAWAVRRLGRRGAGLAGGRGVLEVLAATAVSPDERVVLLRLGGRMVLIGTGPAGPRKITELTDVGEIERIDASLGGRRGRGRPAGESKA